MSLQLLLPRWIGRAGAEVKSSGDLNWDLDKAGRRAKQWLIPLQSVGSSCILVILPVAQIQSFHN